MSTEYKRKVFRIEVKKVEKEGIYRIEVKKIKDKI